MKEGILNIRQIHRPSMCCSHGEKQANWSNIGHKWEGVNKGRTINLSVSLSNQASLKVINLTIRANFITWARPQGLLIRT